MVINKLPIGNSETEKILKFGRSWKVQKIRTKGTHPFDRKKPYSSYHIRFFLQLSILIIYPAF